MIRLFADDSNVFVISNDIVTLFRKSNAILQDIQNWLVCNKLVLNTDKTSYMIFKPTQFIESAITSSNLNLCTDGFQITRCYNIKYLGIFIDDNLTWKVHINSLIKKLVV